MNHMGLSAIHPSVVVVYIVDHGITVHHTRLSDTPRTSLCRGEACLHPGGRLSSNHYSHRSFSTIPAATKPWTKLLRCVVFT